MCTNSWTNSDPNCVLITPLTWICAIYYKTMKETLSIYALLPLPSCHQQQAPLLLIFFLLLIRLLSSSPPFLPWSRSIDMEAVSVSSLMSASPAPFARTVAGSRARTNYTSRIKVAMAISLIAMNVRALGASKRSFFFSLAVFGSSVRREQRGEWWGEDREGEGEGRVEDRLLRREAADASSWHH